MYLPHYVLAEMDKNELVDYIHQLERYLGNISEMTDMKEEMLEGYADMIQSYRVLRTIESNATHTAERLGNLHRIFVKKYNNEDPFFNVSDEKTKTIWARIGMSLKVSDYEYWKLKERIEKEGCIEMDQDNELLKRFLKDGYADGESYIPPQAFHCNEEKGEDEDVQKE
jgi:hypothetical protein